MAGRFARRLVLPRVCVAVAICAAAWWHAPLIRHANAYEPAPVGAAQLGPPAVSYGQPSPGPPADAAPSLRPQPPYVSAQAPYAASQAPYTPAQVPYAAVQTPYATYATPQAPNPGAQGPYPSPHSAYAVVQTPYAGGYASGPTFQPHGPHPPPTTADWVRSAPRATIIGAYALPYHAYRAAPYGTIGGLGPGGEPGPTAFPASLATPPAPPSGVGSDWQPAPALPSPGWGSVEQPAPADSIEAALPGPIWPARSPTSQPLGPTAPINSASDMSGGVTNGSGAGSASSVLFGDAAETDSNVGLLEPGPVDSFGSDCSPVFGGVPSCESQRCVGWQLMPNGLMYPSYLAGAHEPRFGSQWSHITDDKWYWDAALGGRVGMLRYGSFDSALPQGWQLDVAGAAFPRLSLEEDRDLVSVDFCIGVPLTLRRGPWEWKFGYYHLSSHLGDEYMLRHARPRINYVREALIWAVAWRPWADLRLYAEADFAFYTDGGAEPWAFQFGADYSPVRPSGIWGAPFVAVNGQLREENDFGGNVTFQTGWQWRGSSGHLLRTGFHYFNGMSPQYQFFNEHEEQIGVGLWYDY